MQCLVMSMSSEQVMNKYDLYKQAIDLLKYIELSIEDKEHYKIVRKQVLDLANNILRMED